MKLYTEEQVIQLLDHHTVLTPNWIKHYLNKLPPIELPSDEEIDMKFGKRITMYDLGYTDGAKWMKDKIAKNK